MPVTPTAEYAGCGLTSVYEHSSLEAPQPCLATLRFGVYSLISWDALSPFLWYGDYLTIMVTTEWTNETKWEVVKKML